MITELHDYEVLTPLVLYSMRHNGADVVMR